MGMWYKNIDTRTHAVPVGNGNVVGARPQDVVEVEAETPGLIRLIRMRKIIRSGRPNHLTQGIKPKPVQVEVPRKRANTEFAQRTIERGTAHGVDEARRVSAQDAAQRRAAAEKVVAQTAQVAQQAAETIEEAAVAAVEAATEVTPGSVASEKVKAGTAEGNTMGKKSKRR
jgi:hypothetical protein